MTKECDILIAGGGPAGASAALRLAGLDAGSARRVVLLDKAVFPRPKICGGGVVREADRFLSYLGVRVDVPSVPIHRLRLDYAGGSATLARTDAFRVVRREDFDRALLGAAAERGILVRQGERITGFERGPRGIRVATSDGDYHARVVIGADGANSLVRRKLVPGMPPRRFVALDALGPARSPRAEGAANVAVFDFRPVARGIRGYFWEFPCLSGSVARTNYGIGGQSWPRGGASLRDTFVSELQSRTPAAAECSIEGSTIPTYDPMQTQSAPHVLLAGDSVGVDPWLGEGISVAIGTGILAANAAAAALSSGDFGFESYTTRLRDSAVGNRLLRHQEIADRFYEAAAASGGLHGWFEGGTPG